MAKEKTVSGLSAKEKENQDFVEDAFSIQDEKQYKAADKMIKALKGKWPRTSANTKGDFFSIQEPFSLVNLILPSFIFQEPYVTVKPRNARYFKSEKNGVIGQVDSSKVARNMEAVINSHLKKIGQIFEDRKAVQDSLFYPFGVVKDGYSYETISKGDKDYVSKDTGYHKRINPRDFGYHPMATGCDDSIKLVHRSVMTGEGAKKAGIDVSGLEAGIPDYMKKKLDYKGKKSASDNFYTFYEVHDQDADMVYLFGGENKKLLKKSPRGYDYTSSDFSTILFTKDNDDFDGIPMLQMVMPQMNVLNELFTMMVQHMRKFPGQVFASKEGADEDQLEKIRTGEQGSVHVVNDINGIMRTAPLQMGNDYMAVFNLVLGIIDRTLGIPDFKRSSGSGRKSATEASFIQGDATVRRNYFMGIVKDFVLEGIMKQAALKQQFQNEREIIQASGELQNEIFHLSKEDIQGEFLFDFDIENMAASNEAQANNMNNLLNVLSSNPFFQPVLAKLDPFKFGKKAFSLVKVPYESMTKEGISDVNILMPDKENKLAETGKLMPRPVEGEPYEDHIKEHKKFIEDKKRVLGEQAAQDPAVNQVIEHIAETELLMNGPEPQQGQPGGEQPMTPEQGQPEMMQPEGPQGPLQS